jgi:hypothetical protein
MPAHLKKPATSTRVRVEQRWLQLCHQAAVEKDPHDLMEFVREINSLLDEKHSSLRLGRGADSRVRRTG